MKKNRPLSAAVLSLLLCCAFTSIFTAMGSRAFAQEISATKVTITFSGENMADALSKLADLSHVKFAYDAEKLSLEKFNSPKRTFTTATLGKILDAVLTNTNIGYKELSGSILLYVKPVVKQHLPGKIAGRVINDKGEPLPGASIRINETGANFQTDADGTYQLNLAPGIYTLEVSYISYQGKRITGVVIAESKSTFLDIAMLPGRHALGEVVVTSSYKKASVEGLYAKQKNSVTLTDGISAEQIARTPDKNIGESLKRISGVSTIDNKYVVVRGLGERYNGAMLNGQLMPSTELNRKQFSFDVIPSSLVDNVIVSKSITPDMSAEFGGGLVAVNTKTIPTENFMSVTVGGSGNDRTTGKTFRSLKLEGKEYLGSLSDHRKLFGSFDWKSTQDIVATGKFDGPPRYKLNNTADFNNNWGLSQFKPAPSPNFQLSYGHVFPHAFHNGKVGIIAAFDYRNTLQTQDIRMGRDGFEDKGIGTFVGEKYGFTTSVSAIAGIGYTNPHVKISLQTLYLRTLDQQLVLGIGDHADNGHQFAYYDLTTQNTLLQHSFKGEYLPGKSGVKFNWNLSYTNLDRQKPDNHILRGGIAKDATLDEINVSDPVNGGYESKGGAGRWWNRTGEKNLGWNADVILPFKFNFITALSNTFKAGYAGWYKDRFLYVLNTTSYTNTDDNPPLLKAFDQEHITDILYSRFGDDFHKKVTLNAGYMMLDQKIGKFRFVWGERVEYYDLNKANNVLDSLFRQINKPRADGQKFDYTELKNREKNMQFFPSANLIYSLTPSMNLRLAYSKSIIRPDLRELSYFQEYDFELGGLYTTNAPIQSTIIHNYDFRYEWYPAPGDILSFSLFYKDLAYPMEIYKQGSNRIYFLHNNKSAKNKGIELELRKSFAFTGLPVIKHITLYSNFTALDASVVPLTINYYAVDPNNPLKITPTETLGKEEKRPQAGVSNYTYNGGFQYDDKKYSFNLSYNYVSNRTFRAAEQYPESLFERPINSLDGQVAFHFLKQKATVKLNVSNLLNASGIVYTNLYNGQAVPGGNYGNYPRPSTKDLLYDPKTDRVDYKASPGRTYSFAFTYNF